MSNFSNLILNRLRNSFFPRAVAVAAAVPLTLESFSEVGYKNPTSMMDHMSHPLQGAMSAASVTD